MKRVLLALAISLMGAVALAPAAEAHGGVIVGVGVGGWGGPGWRGGYYPYYAPYYSPYYGYPSAYYPPAYYAPPPTVVYQAAPPVGYAQPSYVQQQPAPVESAPPPEADQSAPATQTSNTYTDHQGRKCRMFQSAMEDGSPVTGTACQQPDGSWRTAN